MINKKQGISLIVLVITIIVIIILAGAVILSLSANNPIQKASDAKVASNTAEVQAAVTLYLAKLMAEGQGAATIGPNASPLTNTFATATITIGTTVVTGIDSTKLGMTLPTGNFFISDAGVVTFTP